MKTHVVVPGEARGELIVLDEPLSFWGGFDAESGMIIDEHHPQIGANLTDKIVVMPFGRGSSSASSVIVEAARLGTAPAALVMQEADEIITTGAVVADELYARALPILLVDDSDYERLTHSARAVIAVDGTMTAS